MELSFSSFSPDAKQYNLPPGCALVSVEKKKKKSGFNFFGIIRIGGQQTTTTHHIVCDE